MDDLPNMQISKEYKNCCYYLTMQHVEHTDEHISLKIKAQGMTEDEALKNLKRAILKLKQLLEPSNSLRSLTR